jgi:hypothetical protein
MLKWIKLLLSDSSQASVRRIIGFISFIELLIITNVALFTKVALLNITLIIVAFNIFAAITMIAIFLLTATNIAKIIYSPSSNSIEEDINSETTIQ